MSRTKEQMIAHILKQETYTVDSKLYQRTFTRMMKLPIGLLRDLDLLLVFRVQESNQLDREVQRILAK